MNATLRLFALAALLLLSACQTIAVDTDWDTQADFDGLSTWAWLPRPATGSGNPKIPGDILDRRVRTAVEQEFARKGHALDGGGAPTFYVTYHVAIEEKLDVTTFDDGVYGRDGYYGRGWSGSRTVVTQWDQGTLAIDVVNAGTQELMWRGIATAVVEGNRTPAEREARIREAVAQVLAEFPPGRTK